MSDLPGYRYLMFEGSCSDWRQPHQLLVLSLSAIVQLHTYGAMLRASVKVDVTIRFRACAVTWLSIWTGALVCLAAWLVAGRLLKRFFFVGYNHSEK